MKCMMNNVGEKSKCAKFFDSYNKCKTFWNNVYMGRKRADLKPYLPPVHQRQAFLEKYVQTKKVPISVDDEMP